MRWWRYVNAVTQAMMDDDEIVGYQTALAQQLALVSHGNLQDQDFADAQKRSKELLNEVINLLQPWSSKSVQQAQDEETNKLLRLYKEKVGDPSDPVFLAKVERSWAKLGQADKDAALARKAEEQRMQQLFEERDRTYKAIRERRKT